MPLGFIVSSMICVPAKLMVVLAACAIDRLRRREAASSARSAACCGKVRARRPHGDLAVTSVFGLHRRLDCESKAEEARKSGTLILP